MIRKLSQKRKHTTPHSPNVLVPQHSSRKNAKTNKQKTTEMQKIQEQERKIVPINGMRVKRGEKRLKREKSGNID